MRSVLKVEGDIPRRSEWGPGGGVRAGWFLLCIREHSRVEERVVQVAGEKNRGRKPRLSVAKGRHRPT